MLKLKDIKRKTGEITVFEYEVTHSNEDTTLEGGVLVEALDPNFYTDPKVLCTLELSGCEAPTVEESLDKMADWCERIAKGLRERRRAISVFT
jgi:hypothetical protein